MALVYIFFGLVWTFTPTLFYSEASKMDGYIMGIILIMGGLNLLK